MTSYELEFAEFPDHLYAKVRCPSFSLELGKSYMKEIAYKCRELNVRNLLVERQVNGGDSNLEAYIVISDFCAAAPAPLRMAITDADAANRKRLTFGCNAAKNSKIEVGVFEGVDEARAWLKAGTAAAAIS